MHINLSAGAVCAQSCGCSPLWYYLAGMAAGQYQSGLQAGTVGCGAVARAGGAVRPKRIETIRQCGWTACFIWEKAK